MAKLDWAIDPAARNEAVRLLGENDPRLAREAVEALADCPELAGDLLTWEIIEKSTRDPDPRWRSVAAVALRIRGDAGTSALFDLLHDKEPEVAADAVRTAGAIHNRAYLDLIVMRLGQTRLCGAAIEALLQYGPRIIGTLGDLLHDESLPVQIRRQAPRVLKRIPEQRSVDVLLGSLDHPNLAIRESVLRALHRLRETHPHLQFGPEPVTRQIHREARYYYVMNKRFYLNNNWKFKITNYPVDQGTIPLKRINKWIRY